MRVECKDPRCTAGLRSSRDYHVSQTTKLVGPHAIAGFGGSQQRAGVQENGQRNTSKHKYLRISFDSGSSSMCVSTYDVSVLHEETDGRGRDVSAHF